MLADKAGELEAKKVNHEMLSASKEDDIISTVESYKRRYNSHLRNPLQPPKELLVGIPPKHAA